MVIASIGIIVDARTTTQRTLDARKGSLVKL
jgi:hypothetical protein